MLTTPQPPPLPQLAPGCLLHDTLITGTYSEKPAAVWPTKTGTCGLIPDNSGTTNTENAIDPAANVTTITILSPSRTRGILLVEIPFHHPFYPLIVGSRFQMRRSRRCRASSRLQYAVRLAGPGSAEAQNTLHSRPWRVPVPVPSDTHQAPQYIHTSVTWADRVIVSAALPLRWTRLWNL
ncbi:hypothetical protein CHU98_g518 [Xylaria longipes]|nr:hypothetical protein CHU98_g518 [Xylaria longipes]